MRPACLVFAGRGLGSSKPPLLQTNQLSPKSISGCLSSGHNSPVSAHRPVRWASYQYAIDRFVTAIMTVTNSFAL